jgi:hypothetical protein
LPLAPTIIVINDFEEEEIEVEDVDLEVPQPTEVEQPTNFSLKPIQGGLFDVEPNSLDIPIILPTKV